MNTNVKCRRPSKSLVLFDKNMMIDGEIWKEFTEGDITYRISSKGRFCVLKNGEWYLIKQQKEKNGYNTIRINHRRIYTHRMVAKFFLKDYQLKPEVNHIDGDKTNNDVFNLEMVTHRENMLHAINKLGINIASFRGRCGYLHPTSKQVVCLDLNGNFIKEYGSISVAASELGLSLANISRVCNHIPGHYKCGGYRWEFKENINLNN